MGVLEGARWPQLGGGRTASGSSLLANRTCSSREKCWRRTLSGRDRNQLASATARACWSRADGAFFRREWRRLSVPWEDARLRVLFEALDRGRQEASTEGGSSCWAIRSRSTDEKHFLLWGEEGE